jgi:hypothetical protein
MKLNTILNPLLRESSQGPRWVFPNDKALETEYKVEYLHHVKHDVGNIFPTFEIFVQACKKGHPLEVTEALDGRIQNRSHTGSQQELLAMISQYRSYPEFRNEKTVQNLYDRMENGGDLDMPILLKKRHSNNVRVMSGNTRMDVAFQCGVNPSCLVVEY